MDLKIALIMVAIGYSFYEGVREYFFYTINRKGGFPDRFSDKVRKTLNAIAFVALFLIAGLFLGFGDWLLAAFVTMASFIRWIVLDGTLNAFRGLPFFYTGSVASLDVLMRNLAEWTDLPGRLLSGTIKVVALGISIFIYIHLQ